MKVVFIAAFEGVACQAAPSKLYVGRWSGPIMNTMIKSASLVWWRTTMSGCWQLYFSPNFIWHWLLHSWTRGIFIASYLGHFCFLWEKNRIQTDYFCNKWKKTHPHTHTSAIPAAAAPACSRRASRVSRRQVLTTYKILPGPSNSTVLFYNFILHLMSTFFPSFFTNKNRNKKQQNWGINNNIDSFHFDFRVEPYFSIIAQIDIT